MSPLISVSNSLSHPSVITDGSVKQSSSVANNILNAAPPPLDVALQPRPPNVQNSPSGGISALKHSSTVTETHSNSSKTQSGGINKSSHDKLPKDPSTAIIEQHNVRVVPAVLSFGSLSSFSLSTNSMSQHSIPPSNIPVNNSTSVISGQPSVTNTPSLFKPSDVYNSPSISQLASNVSWSRPNRPIFTDNTSLHWSSLQSDSKVKCLHKNVISKTFHIPSLSFLTVA